jgi:nitroimidazol reductase NimA-like FMN-containing flavoprotein (pyridoxamine 5'-phosphate oxidase superfamily)
MKVVIEDRAEMQAIFGRAQVGRLGLADENEPYVVPLNFVYSDGRICFHTGLEGRKLDIMWKNPRVCFEVDEILEVVINEETTCFSTAYYKSVIAWGSVRVLDDAAEKMKALDLLMEKYAAGKKYEPIPEYALAIVNVCEIKIEEMTGKANLPDDGESPQT